jgi:hypothetical protein
MRFELRRDDVQRVTLAVRVTDVFSTEDAATAMLYMDPHAELPTSKNAVETALSTALSTALRTHGERLREHAGFWFGDHGHEDYDTQENADKKLVELVARINELYGLTERK